MPYVYDNWEKLVAAVVQTERNRKLCYSESFSSVSSSDGSAASRSTRNFSFDLSSSDQLNEQAPRGGNSPSFATTSSASASIFNHVPKPPKMPSGSRFDKIFGAAIRFVTPGRKRPESRITNLPQDINAPDKPEIQSGYSAPTEIEVEGDIPTIDAHVLSYNELKEQTGNFGPRALIAKGFPEKVYFAWLKSGKDVALKVLDSSSESDSNDEFLTKVSIVSRFKHENVVEFLGHYIDNYRRILAYEFATMGTLHDALHGRKSVVPGKQVRIPDWRQRVRIAVDAARGLEYLHENAAIHKDIRSGNILLFDDFKAKIADINLSTKDFHGYFSPDPEFHYSLTATHPSFESHASGITMLEHLTQESDVYNFGVILLELLTGRTSNTISRGPRRYQAFVTWAKPRLTKDKVNGYVDRKLMGNYPPEAAAKFADIAEQCLQDEAEYRPHMRVVVKALQSLLETQYLSFDYIDKPDIQRGYSDPTELEVKGDIPTIDAYALSFNELKKQTYNFGQQAVIAEGFYAIVYFARLKTGKDIVLKMLDATSESDSKDEFLTKVSTVSRFKHENVVEFLGYCIEKDRRILAYEFATMRTLHIFLHESKGVTGKRTGPVLDWMQRVRIATDAARGLEYLHENGAIHKDIRSSNVLLFKNFKAKIADINISTKDFEAYLDPDPLYYLIRPQPPGYEYHASESCYAGTWTQKSDVYSFGVVLLELLTGRKCIDETLPEGQQNLVTWAKPQLTKNEVRGCVDPKLMGEYPPKAAAKFADVAAQCLQYKAEHRPYMRVVVKNLQSLLEAPAPGI